MSTVFIIVGILLWFALCLIRRDVALALLILLLPTYQIRFTIFGIPSTFLEACIGILVVCWVVALIRDHTRPIIPHKWLVVAFILGGALATVVSVDLRAGLGLFKAYIVEPVLVYCVAINSLRSKRSIELVNGAIALLTIGIAAYGILQIAHLVPTPEPYNSELPRRITSVFLFPTAIGKLLGPLIAYSLVMFFYRFWSADRSEKNISSLFGLAALAGSLSLWFSVNRGAILGVIASLFVLVWFAKRKKLFITLTLAIVAFLVLLPPVQGQIVKVLNRQDTSTDVRIVMWQGTLRLLKAHPIFGSGLGGFPKMYDAYRDASHVELFPNPDQLFLTLWAELGLIGGVIFIIVMARWITLSINAIRNKALGGLSRIIGIAGLAAIVAFTVHGMLDTPYFKNDLSVMFWILFSLLVLASRGFVQPEKTTTLEV